MKTFIAIATCALLAPWCSAESNVVGNPSFEDISAGFDCSAGPNSHYGQLISYWAHAAPWTVPQKRAYCMDNTSVGSPDISCTVGHTGTHSGFCGYKEYIVQQIPATQGGLYYVEYYVKGSTADFDGGLRLFTDKPKQCSSYSEEISDDGPPQVPIPPGLDISQWTKISGYFVGGNFSWFALGSFNTGSGHPGSGYYFDDIKILRMGASACPDVSYIQNTSFQDIGKITYRSQNLTIGGKNIASTLAQGNVVVGSNAVIDFKSATQVILEDGFSTELGARFQAYIAPCNSDCPPPVAHAGPDATSCGGAPIALGGDAELGNTYTWSANPSNALAFLSNASAANPVFSPPAAGNGAITYTLTVKNACNQIATDQTVVKYETSVTSTPTVSVSNISSTDLIEFDVAMGSHTSDLIIEIWSGSGSLVHSYTYSVGVDFACCNYHWRIPEPLSPCVDYQIKVFAQNLCSPALSAPQIINWVRNKTPSFAQVSNVFVLHGSANDDAWCFTFAGAVSYNVVIKSPSGATVYNASGSVLPPRACIWRGECNQPGCLQAFVDNGTYYYVLTLTGCAGNSIVQNGFITVLSPP